MAGVVGMEDRKERPAYVRFERVAVEDKAASLREGHYVARDVDMANVTPPYSKDVFKTKASSWFATLEQDVQNGRIDPRWVEDYKAAYARWKAGEELPLNGTPIKGWGVISPAQQETLIRMNVLTVEDLAAMNDEGIRRVGMGGNDLKNKAGAWLAQLKDKGPLTQEVASIKAENLLLKTSVETLTKQVEALMAQGHMQASAEPAAQDSIGASDILDSPDPVVRRGPGRPPKPAVI